jgi:murein L,D-transpeptidase YafK
MIGKNNQRRVSMGVIPQKESFQIQRELVQMVNIDKEEYELSFTNSKHTKY